MQPDSAALSRIDRLSTVDLSGQCVGNSYILVQPIGEGATGTVWRAIDRATGEQVAAKLLRRDLTRQPKAVTRFVQERAILLMLRHPHIVRVRDLLTVGDSLGLVMDLVSGGSLRDHLVDRGTLAPGLAAELLAQVADALAEAHRLGVVHRDLKPDNILLDRAGELTARLTDFGIARVLDAPGLTTPEALIGTPNYMAPEVINGSRPDPAVDVYAVGIVLYELVVGRPPYAGGPPVAVLRRHVDETPPRPEGIPDSVWAVVEACLDKDPERRPTAAQLVTTLRSLARMAADAPALPPAPEPVYIPAQAAGGLKLRPAVGDPTPGATRRGHPSSPGRPRPRPRRNNRPGTWRWARLGALAVLVAGAVLTQTLPGMSRLHLLDGRHHPAHSATAPGTSPRAATPAQAHSGAPTATAAASAPAAAVSVEVSLPGVQAGGRVQVYGPWQCADSWGWDPGHPVLAKPCYATGGGVRVIGHMQAVPGVQADVSVSVQDADTGAVAAGPYTCDGLMFTDFAPEHSCGPFDLNALAHGHRYAVVEQWQYTGRGVLPGGSARGPDFSW